jgi:predicted GIY-YIG superfamily endonuclease
MPSDSHDELVSLGFVKHDSYACAVYALVWRDEVIYIGQTTNVFRRLTDHLRLGRHNFEFVYLLYCKQEELDRVEQHMIKHFQPKNNTSYKKIKLSDIGLGKIKSAISSNPLDNLPLHSPIRRRLSAE